MSGYPKISSEPAFTIFESGFGRIFSEPYYIPTPDGFFEWLPGLELEVLVVLLPLYHFLHMLPFDSCFHLEVLVPHLKLGDEPVLRKMVDLDLVVPAVAHHLLP
jgi:hypothetical protein